MNKPTSPTRRHLLKAMAAGMAAAATPGMLHAAVAAQSGSAPRVLIVYYSRSGNTRTLAEELRRLLNLDPVHMRELRTVTPYPDDYRATTDQAKRELQEGFLPPLAAPVPDMTEYDTLLLGSPNWWSSYAAPVRTFLAGADLNGKTVGFFMTHGGSGLANSLNDIKSQCPQAVIAPGLAVRGNNAASSRNEAQAWLKQLGLLQ